MRYIDALRVGPRRVPMLLGTITGGIEQTPYTRRLYLPPQSTPCLPAPACHLQMVVSHIPHGTSWLRQASRTLCSIPQAKTHAAQGAMPGKENSFKYVQPTTRLKMVMEYFNVSKTSSSKIINSDPRLKSCDVYTLARNMNTLQENKISAEDVKKVLPLLYRSPLSTEHRIAILKELGLCNLNAQHYLQFSRLYKCTVAALKSCRLLPENYEPHNSVLASLGVPQELSVTTRLPRDINQCTLAELHMELSNVFLRWELNCDQENISRIRQIYKITKSMTLQQRLLHQLYHQWNINADKASLISVPRICSLHPDTLQERLSLLQKVPEFAALSYHPRFLHLLVHFNKASSRLDFLQQMKNTNVFPTLNTLCGTSKMFHRYVAVGDHRYNKREVINCLAKQMNETSSTIREALHFQSWSQGQTTIVSVRKNLLKLRKEGFTKEQLLAALDVVLYPPELLSDQLAQLPLRAQAQPFTTLKSKPHALQLLLYFMNKNMSCPLS
ncbi:transcription termination factor 5, mitochondrial isoform X2 [Procambarus clarkii]|uniref:transcription termination factor 5, mitochondrial isoform X2 n=1 Tax=Procambarus clarkii TaxID=6728 RepID=UPI003743F256